MPVLLVPALWVGGTAVVLGGGYYVLHTFHVIPWLKKGASAMASRAQKSKVSKVMREHKQGTLRSSSGRKVKSRKQAVAIAMSESGQLRKRKKAS